MRIYQLTDRGKALSYTPTHEMTPGWKVVYFLKRHGGTASDEQIRDFVGLDQFLLKRTMDNLVSQQVVAVN